MTPLGRDLQEMVARYGWEGYVSGTMLYAFSLATKAGKVPAGPDWIHKIKYDGYRMMVVREQNRVRLISRGGHDWARYFPPVEMLLIEP
jgi:ATP-dependent DNA ligase